MSPEESQLDRYCLQEHIGEGGGGQVYRAIDTHMPIPREVAVKVIHLIKREDMDTDSVIALFQREVTATAKLRHPHILPLFDYGIQLKTMRGYIVMPLYQQGSLKAWRGERILSLEVIMHFLHQAAAALRYAHDNDIIHKDVKPQNFLIQENIDDPNLPDIVLTDFGIAKLHTASTTLGNRPFGTPFYMAPEQWDGNPVFASDQYSLAIMAYELLTGCVPFSQGSIAEIKKNHLIDKPDPPSKLNPDIPVGLDTIILKALEKDPQERYKSITEFVKTLITKYKEAKGQKRLTEIEQRIVEGEKRIIELQQRLLEGQESLRVLQQKHNTLLKRQIEEQEKIDVFRKVREDEVQKLLGINRDIRNKQEELSNLQAKVRNFDSSAVIKKPKRKRVAGLHLTKGLYGNREEYHPFWPPYVFSFEREFKKHRHISRNFWAFTYIILIILLILLLSGQLNPFLVFLLKHQ